MATRKKPAPTKKAPARKAAPAKKTYAPKKAAPAAKARSKPGPMPVAQQKLDAIGIDNVCAQIAEGETLTEIAKKAGVSVGTLLTWIEVIPERSARAREARSYVARLHDEKAEDGLVNAKNAFELAKAKEIAHHLRWRSSRIDPKGYGDRIAAEVSGPGGGPLVVVKDMTGRKD